MHINHYKIKYGVCFCGTILDLLSSFSKQMWLTTLDTGIGDKYIVQPSYQFLADNDFSHGDEVTFYCRSYDKIWEIFIRRHKEWEDSDTDWTPIFCSLNTNFIINIEPFLLQHCISLYICLAKKKAMLAKSLSRRPMRMHGLQTSLTII